MSGWGGAWLAAALLMSAPMAAALAAPPSPSIAGTAGAFALSGPMIQGGVLLGVAPVDVVDLRLDGQPLRFDRDRRFLIAFDRDAGEQARLTARLADGRLVEQTLTIARRAWRIEHIDAPMRPTRDSRAFMALRMPELERIAAARAVRSDSSGWRQRFIRPRTGRISGLFGAQRIYRGTPGAYHSGLDIAGATGAVVVAPADGVVVLAADRPFTLEGNLLIIDHGHGLNSAFLHLSRIDVKLGDHIVQGQPIGAVGSTGRATGPHLHWAVKWNDARVDPLFLIEHPATAACSATPRCAQ